MCPVELRLGQPWKFFCQQFLNFFVAEVLLKYPKLYLMPRVLLIYSNPKFNKYPDHEEARNCPFFFSRKIVFVLCSR